MLLKRLRSTKQWVNQGEAGETMTTFGEKLRQLMTEQQMSQRKLAELVPCNDGYLSRVARDLGVPSAELAARLDEVLAADGTLAALRPERTMPTAEEALKLAAWLEETNVGDGGVNYLETATRRLVYDYPRLPPLTVLRQAQSLQGRIVDILRGGRQRIAQTQALLGISAELSR